MSKPSNHTLPPGIRINAFLQVSRPTIEQSTQQTYRTASLDVFAYREGGREIFEYFHLLTVPDHPSQEFIDLQRQLNESLIADLREFVRTIEHDGRVAEGGGIT